MHQKLLKSIKNNHKVLKIIKKTIKNYQKSEKIDFRKIS